MKIKKLLFIGLLLSSLLLTACKQQGVEQLKQKMTNTKQEIIANSSQPLKMIAMDSVQYQAHNLSSPFLADFEAAFNENASPLQQYPLAQLTYLGSISLGKMVWGVVATPNGKVFRVTVGEKIGQERAAIRNIANKAITVIDNKKVTRLRVR